MQITVLCGGPSAEREISLISGNAVADALRQGGHDVFVSDVSPTDLSGLDHPADVIFPVLHGDFGESGDLQEILEARQLPFVGSGSVASKLGMDKIAAKEKWKAAGLPTPAWRVISPPLEGGAGGGVSGGSPSQQSSTTSNNPWRKLVGDFNSAHSGKIPPTLPSPSGGEGFSPVVVKAIDSGSSIDVFICKTESDATAAAQDLLKRHGKAMVEQFISGPELTVGLLEGKALPPIRIQTSREFFDFKAKYTAGGAKHDFDLKLPAAVVEKCKSLAEQANRILGCRDLARVDIMLDEQLNPYLLEINTIPGFTSVSLLPEAAAKTGISFVQLVDRLARMAMARTNSRVTA